MEIYYIAFLDLSTCRALGHGSEGPIPWNAALQWAVEHELSKEQKEDLFYHIAVMDNVYLTHRAKKMKDELSKSAKGKK